MPQQTVVPGLGAAFLINKEEPKGPEVESFDGDVQYVVRHKTVGCKPFLVTLKMPSYCRQCGWGLIISDVTIKRDPANPQKVSSNHHFTPMPPLPVQ